MTITVITEAVAPDLIPLFTMAGAHLPGEARAACWSNGFGVWSHLFQLNPDVMLTLFRPDRKRLSVHSSAFWGRTSGDWKFDTYACLTKAAKLFGWSKPSQWRMGLILRQNSLIVLVDDEQTGRYLPAPHATGHDILADTEDLEDLFPGRFVFGGLEHERSAA